MLLALLLALSIHPFDSGVVEGVPYTYTGIQHFNPAPHVALGVPTPPVGTAKVEVNVQYDTDIYYFFSNPWPVPIDAILISTSVQHWWSNPEGETYPYLGALGSPGSFLLTDVPINGTWTSGPIASSHQQVFTFGTTADCTPAVPLDQFALDPTLYYASTFVSMPAMALFGGRRVDFPYLFDGAATHYCSAYLTSRAHGYLRYLDAAGNEL